MSTPFRHAAVFGKFQAQGVRPILEEIARFLVECGIEVSVDRETADSTGWHEFGALGIDELATVCDLAVVVGGDGTMLGIGREFARHGIPLIGINRGRLGFITDIPSTDWRGALGPIVHGNYEQESRAMVEGGVWRDGTQVFQGFALNDVVVRSIHPSMIELRVSVGSDHVANIRCDGMIVASPTGSTAYALSAGGPILHPALSAIALVPISPHTLSNRPVAIRSTSKVEVTLVRGVDARANFDVQSYWELEPNDVVCVSAASRPATLLHPRSYRYFSMLRQKLRWTERTS